ncbi:phage portal protein [Aeromonas sobria]|uniref:phage portal protein n=1 Tax=Aeromonas sobria TaxID=646 RepID=UPI000C6D972E|nr:phage portal protein [Aeromonas sobria]PKQ78082.1 phage portal protein [Aeromonas sobria]
MSDIKQNPLNIQRKAWNTNIIDQFSFMTTTPKAINHTVVAACIKVIGETVGKLPVRLMKDGKEVLKHDSKDILTRFPNQFQTTQDLMEMIIHHLCSDGNFYAQLLKTPRGKLVGINPIETPESVGVDVDEQGNLRYRVPSSSGIRVFNQSEILHIKMGSPKLLKGLSCIGLARSSIAISIAQEQYASSFTKNASAPSAVVTIPGADAFTDELLDRIGDGLNNLYGGAEAAGAVAVIPADAKWQAVTLNHKDAQFLESRQFQKSEICSMFRVPEHMVNGSANVKYSNLEQSKLSFLTDCIAPYISRIENTFSRHLDVDLKIDISELKRGDSAAQIQYAKTGLQSGLFTLNEARALLNMDSLPDGDVFLIPANNTRIGTLDQLIEYQDSVLNVTPPDPISDPITAGGSDTNSNNNDSNDSTDTGNPDA